MVLEEYEYQIGNTIRLLREHKSLSQEQLAEISQIDRSYISQIEGGRNLTIEMLYKISCALDETPASILNKVEMKINSKLERKINYERK